MATAKMRGLQCFFDILCYNTCFAKVNFRLMTTQFEIIFYSQSEEKLFRGKIVRRAIVLGRFHGEQLSGGVVVQGELNRGNCPGEFYGCNSPEISCPEKLYSGVIVSGIKKQGGNCPGENLMEGDCPEGLSSSGKSSLNLIIIIYLRQD